MSTAPQTGAPAVTGPYVGLRFYTEADAPLFFGRDAERQVIMGNLRASRLTLLYAQSGVGKSSLLRAGVTARLRELARRTFAEGGSPCYVPVVLSAWADDPVDALIGEIEAAANALLPGDAHVRLARGSLRRAIGVATLALDQAAAGDGWEEPATTLLIILDQFEEYFLYGVREAQPGRFADELAACLRCGDLRANVLISIREDAYSALGDLLKGRISNVYGNYLHLEFLGEDAAREAIVKPVEHFNAERPQHERVTIEEGLADTVLREIAREPLGDDGTAQRVSAGNGGAAGPPVAARAIETPYLQLVMQRLWEVTVGREQTGGTISAATLRDLGGPRRIVSDHLERSLTALSADEQAIAAGAFRFLVTTSGTKVAQRAVDLAEWTGRPEDAVVAVLEELSTGRRGRILRPLPPAPGETSVRYELFHDVLAEPILDWRRRYERERESERLTAQLEADLRARQKARRDRLLRRLAIGLGVAVVALAVVVVLTRVAAHRDALNRRTAQSVGLAASAQAQLTVDPELSLLLALEALKVKETPEATGALAAGLAASRVRATLTPTRARACGQECRPQPTAAGTPLPVAVPGDAFALKPGDWRGRRVAFDSRTGTVAVVSKGAVRLWQPQTGRQRVLPGLESVSSAAFIPERRALLAVGEDFRLALAPLAGRASPRTLDAFASGAAVSPDGRFVATADQDEVVVRRLPDGRAQATLPRWSLGVAFSPADPDLLLVDMGDHALLWRWREGHATRRLSPTGAAEGIPAGFSPDGAWVATATPEGGVRVWDARTGARRYAIRPDSGTTVRAIFNGAGTRLLTVSQRGAMLRYAATGRILSALAWPAGTIRSAAFSPDGALVAAGGDDGTIRVFESVTGAPLMELRGHSAVIADLDFTPDGRFLISADGGGSARLWGVSEARTLPAVGEPVAALAFGRDGALAVAGYEGLGLVWGARGDRPDTIAREPGGTFESAAFSPRGRLVAFSGSSASATEGVVLVADRRAGGIRRRLRAGPGDTPVIRFSPDGRLLLTAGRGRPRLWSTRDWSFRPLGRIRYTTPASPDPHDRQLRSQLDAAAETVASAAFSRDGSMILLTTDQGAARLVDARTGLTRRVFYGHVPSGQAQAVTAGDLSPDGRWAVTAAGAQALVWSVRTGAVRARLTGHVGAVNSAAFGRDGARIVTAGDDRTVRVWDARSGRALAVLRNHASPVRAAGFSPSGDDIASGDDAGVVREYPCLPCATLARLRALARTRVTRALTREERALYLGQIGA